jgi:hypothetical protein
MERLPGELPRPVYPHDVRLSTMKTAAGEIIQSVC